MRAGVRNLLIVSALALALLAVIRYLYPKNYQGNHEGLAGSDSFTLYYADWCPHCKTVKPIFADWSKKGTIDVGGKTVFVSMVEASDPKSKNPNVKGFPTMLLEKGDGSVVEFSGDRTPAGWESWLKQNV